MSVDTLPSSEECNCFAVRAAARHVTQSYDQFLAPTGLRTTQFSILAKLKRKGPLTINALAEDMVMDRTTLGRTILPLERDGLMTALGIPPDVFFQIIHILARSQFLHTPSFLGLKYSDDLILLEVTFISGRPKEKRLGLLKALNDGVVAAAGISPDDLLITLYETPGENISFGRGLAQRAHVSDKDAKAAALS